MPRLTATTPEATDPAARRRARRAGGKLLPHPPVVDHRSLPWRPWQWWELLGCFAVGVTRARTGTAPDGRRSPAVTATEQGSTACD